MHEMNSLKSLSLFVGTGKCNANCANCAGIVHRKYAPKIDGEIDDELVRKTLKECHEKGARSLSISSSGEPTLSPLSVTRTLEIVREFGEKEMKYYPVNLYSNGIIIGEDEEFCHNYLSKWKKLGLSRLYVTVHDVDENENARYYRVKKYPSLELVVRRIHESELLVRSNVVLRKTNIGNFEKFKSMVEKLREIRVDSISAWSLRGEDDKIDYTKSPDKEEMDNMEKYAIEISKNGYDLRVLREKNQEAYSGGQKITLFPDGTLSNTWCN